MALEPTELFSALSHSVRLRALMLLQLEGELCVCELTHALDDEQPVISRQLAQLRRAGLVLDRRQGQWVFYRVHPKLAAWAARLLQQTAADVGGRPPFAGDRMRLRRMPDRPKAICCA